MAGVKVKPAAAYVVLDAHRPKFARASRAKLAAPST